MDRLPTELLLEILNGCTKEDHLHLRLVCKRLCIVCTPLAFSSFNLCWFAFSFEKLQHISQSYLAKYVNKLVIFVDYLHDYDQKEDLHLELRTSISKGCSCCPTYAGERCFIPREDWPVVWQIFQFLRNEQAKLVDNAAYLQAFHHTLARLPSLIAVCVRSFDWLDFWPSRMEDLTWTMDNISVALAKSLTAVSRAHRPMNSSKIAASVLEAISARATVPSNSPLHSLVLNLEYNAGWRMSRTPVRHGLAQLRSLQLNLYAHAWNGADEHTLELSLQSEVAFLLQCEALTDVSLELRVTGNVGLDTYGYSSILASMKWPQLQRLALNLTMRNNDMLAFLRCHARTLKSLKLKRCSFENVETILMALPSTIHLEDIHLDSLDDPNSGDAVYFLNGDMDDLTRAWLCNGIGVPPVWIPKVETFSSVDSHVWLGTPDQQSEVDIDEQSQEVDEFSSDSQEDDQDHDDNIALSEYDFVLRTMDSRRRRRR